MKIQRAVFSRVGGFFSTVGCSGLVACLSVATARAVPALPEPGLIMYGNVRSSVNGQLLRITAMGLQVVDSTGNTVSLSGVSSPALKLVTVNSVSFYVVQVPFATRSIGPAGAQVIFDAPVNAFELRGVSSTYTRSASINGKNATFANRAQETFQLTAAERGKFEQVDFVIDEQPVSESTYAAWAAQYFVNLAAAEAQPDFDADGDGLTNTQEYAAGTDPTDPLSAFKTIRIELLANGGFRIEWKSVPGRVYKVEKCTDASLKNWVQLGAEVTASGTTADYVDDTARTDAFAHYRIRVSR